MTSALTLRQLGLPSAISDRISIEVKVAADAKARAEAKHNFNIVLISIRNITNCREWRNMWEPTAFDLATDWMVTEAQETYEVEWGADEDDVDEIGDASADIITPLSTENPSRPDFGWVEDGVFNNDAMERWISRWGDMLPSVCQSVVGTIIHLAERSINFHN